MVDMLQRDAGHVRVFGGGGGVIIPEIDAARLRSCAHLFAGRRSEDGFARMIEDMINRCDISGRAEATVDAGALVAGDHVALARAITALEMGERLDEGTS